MITPQRKRRSWILLLLLIPFIALLYPPFYNVKDPELIGIPFFYWFQLLWRLGKRGDAYVSRDNA